jgi:hypothetical protein
MIFITSSFLAGVMLQFESRFEFTFSIFSPPIESCVANLNCGNGLNPAARGVEFDVVYSFTSKSIQWIM